MQESLRVNNEFSEDSPAPLPWNVTRHTPKSHAEHGIRAGARIVEIFLTEKDDAPHVNWGSAGHRGCYVLRCRNRCAYLLPGLSALAPLAATSWPSSSEYFLPPKKTFVSVFEPLSSFLVE